MNKMSVLMVLFLVVSITPLKQAYSADNSQVKQTWLNLDKSTNQCKDIYDYYPDGGMRIFYCHIKSSFSYSDLVKASHIPVFRKGPHTREELNLKSRFDFGHYNKDFVIWLKDFALLAMGDADFRSNTQVLYDKYIKNLAITYKRTHEELIRDPQYFQRETDKYLALMQNRTLDEYYYDNFYEFKNLYNQGLDGNVVKTAVLFWFRRNIDGTEKEFYDALNTLIKLYSH